MPFVEPDYVPYHQMPYCGFVEGVAWDDADGCWITKVAYPAAPLFTAPQWHRTRREHRDEGEGGSVAGWSELSDAVTVLHMVTMWHVVRPQLKMHAACGQGGLQYDRGVACEHLPPSGMVHSVYRYMDTHRPVKVGGGYRPPQDRPPPVVCS